MRAQVLAALLVAAAVPWPAAVARAQADDRVGRDVLEVALGGSTVVQVSGSVGRVTLTDPTIADVSAAAGGLLIVGRRVGETNLIMFGGSSQSTYLIKVTLPARAIQSELARMFPREDLEARAVGGTIALVGTVSSANVASLAEELVLGYLASPSFQALGVRPNVINMLRIRNRQQVMIEVKFAEVNRRSLREMGLNAIAGRNDGRVGVALGRGGVASTRPGPVAPVPGTAPQAFSPGDNAVGALFLGKPDGSFPFAATLSLLSARNLSRTLAEPTLVAMSGQQAQFLAGGEFPYTRSAGIGGATAVEFKPFGIELGFMPTVLEDDTIQLKTAASVSAPDPTLNIVVDGVVTQGFKRRSSETTIRLRDGQAFAIAGLLSDEMENLIEKVPGLGDLPILGILFSSKSFNRRESELIVVVTARLVEPMDAGDVPPLPGEDRISDPSDLELFLLNLPEPDAPRNPPGAGPRRPRPSASAGRQPVGKIGFWR